MTHLPRRSRGAISTLFGRTRVAKFRGQVIVEVKSYRRISIISIQVHGVVESYGELLGLLTQSSCISS